MLQANGRTTVGRDRTNEITKPNDNRARRWCGDACKLLGGKNGA